MWSLGTSACLVPHRTPRPAQAHLLGATCFTGNVLEGGTSNSPWRLLIMKISPRLNLWLSGPIFVAPWGESRGLLLGIGICPSVQCQGLVY